MSVISCNTAVIWQLSLRRATQQSGTLRLAWHSSAGQQSRISPASRSSCRRSDNSHNITKGIFYCTLPITYNAHMSFGKVRQSSREIPRSCIGSTLYLSVLCFETSFPRVYTTARLKCNHKLLFELTRSLKTHSLCPCVLCLELQCDESYYYNSCLVWPRCVESFMFKW